MLAKTQFFQRNGATGATGATGPAGPVDYRAGQGKFNTTSPFAVTVTFSTPMPNANYAVFITATNPTATTDWRPCYVISKLSASFTLQPKDCKNENLIDRGTDPFEWMVIANK